MVNRVNDKTGRKLKEGQIVDIQLVGMFQGRIREIKDSPITLPGNQQIAPHIVVDIVSTPYIHPAGFVPDLYIMAEPEPEKKVSIVEGNFGGKVQ